MGIGDADLPYDSIVGDDGIGDGCGVLARNSANVTLPSVLLLFDGVERVGLLGAGTAARRTSGGCAKNAPNRAVAVTGVGGGESTDRLPNDPGICHSRGSPCCEPGIWSPPPTRINLSVDGVTGILLPTALGWKRRSVSSENVYLTEGCIAASELFPHGVALI